MTDYPSFSYLRARGPSLRCTHHEELNECGSDSEQKDAHPVSSKDVQVSIIGNSSSMVIICLLPMSYVMGCKLCTTTNVFMYIMATILSSSTGLGD